jgi:AraC-like DNA-binding protein
MAAADDFNFRVLRSDPSPVRIACRIRQQIHNWYRAYRILFPKKAKPAPALPSNVVIMKKVEPHQVKAVAQRLALEMGQQPTHKAIANELGVSRSTVSRHLAKTG